MGSCQQMKWHDVKHGRLMLSVVLQPVYLWDEKILDSQKQFLLFCDTITHSCARLTLLHHWLSNKNSNGRLSLLVNSPAQCWERQHQYHQPDWCFMLSGPTGQFPENLLSSVCGSQHHCATYWIKRWIKRTANSCSIMQRHMRERSESSG